MPGTNVRLRADFAAGAQAGSGAATGRHMSCRPKEGLSRLVREVCKNEAI